VIAHTPCSLHMLIVLVLPIVVLIMLLLGPSIAILSLLLCSSLTHIGISQTLMAILRTGRAQRFLSITSRLTFSTRPAAARLKIPLAKELRTCETSCAHMRQYQSATQSMRITETKHGIVRTQHLSSSSSQAAGPRCSRSVSASAGAAVAAAELGSKPRWRQSSYSCLPARSRSRYRSRILIGARIAWDRLSRDCGGCGLGDVRGWRPWGELFFSRRPSGEVWRSAEPAGGGANPSLASADYRPPPLHLIVS